MVFWTCTSLTFSIQNKTGPTCCSETLVGVRSGSRKSDSSPASADDGFFPLTLEDGTVEEFSEESHAAVFADFDNDGDLDLFNGHTWSGHHRLYRNDGGARFVDISDSAGIDVRDLGPRGVAAADLDGNGFLDIIVTAWEGFIPNVYMNLGGLRFERQRLQGDASADFANQGLSVVDITRNGKPDLALSAFEFVPGVGVGPIAILANRSGRLVENTGFTGLEYEQTTSDFRGTNGYSFQDIDNDGDLDVVITGFHGSKLYRNNGEGRFNLVRRFDGLHYTAAFGDVDNDGDLDLYLAGSTGVHLNDGAGAFTFQDGGLTGIGEDARSAVFADMDNDGALDLLVASKQGPNTFFRNNGAAGGWLGVAVTAPQWRKRRDGCGSHADSGRQRGGLSSRAIVHRVLQPGPFQASFRGGFRRHVRSTRALPEWRRSDPYRGEPRPGRYDRWCPATELDDTRVAESVTGCRARPVPSIYSSAGTSSRRALKAEMRARTNDEIM